MGDDEIDSDGDFSAQWKPNEVYASIDAERDYPLKPASRRRLPACPLRGKLTLCSCITERRRLGRDRVQVRSIVRKDDNWTVDPLRVADPRRHRAAILLVADHRGPDQRLMPL